MNLGLDAINENPLSIPIQSSQLRAVFIDAVKTMKYPEQLLSAPTLNSYNISFIYRLKTRDLDLNLNGVLLKFHFSVLFIITSLKKNCWKEKNNQHPCQYLGWIVSFQNYSACTMKTQKNQRTHWLIVYQRCLFQRWVKRKICLFNQRFQLLYFTVYNIKACFEFLFGDIYVLGIRKLQRKSEMYGRYLFI